VLVVVDGMVTVVVVLVVSVVVMGIVVVVVVGEVTVVVVVVVEVTAGTTWKHSSVVVVDCELRKSGELDVYTADQQ
jgi:hypothetical protein